MQIDPTGREGFEARRVGRYPKAAAIRKLGLNNKPAGRLPAPAIGDSYLLTIKRMAAAAQNYCLALKLAFYSIGNRT